MILFSFVVSVSAGYCVKINVNLMLCECLGIVIKSIYLIKLHNQKKQIMKKILTIAMFCIAAIGYSQDITPTYEAEGTLVKATYYHEDGTISKEGYFKNKKLTSKWTRFDKQGNKVQLAFYKDGKKTGKWFFWNEGSLQEVTYVNNSVKSVNVWTSESKLAFNR